LPPSSSSTPLDKKYPAAVLVGSEADLTGDTVRNSSVPLPAGKPIYYSVRSFGGFGVKELTVKLVKDEQLTELVKIEQLTESPKMSLVYSNVIVIEKGKHDVFGSLPSLTPGNYQLIIYRLDEDIAARNFMIE